MKMNINNTEHKESRGPSVFKDADYDRSMKIAFVLFVVGSYYKYFMIMPLPYLNLCAYKFVNKIVNMCSEQLIQ